MGRSPAWVVTILLACGPRGGDGPGDTAVSSPSTSSSGSTSHEAPTTGGLDCSDSDLPPPLCHRRVPLGLEDSFPAVQQMVAPTPPPGWQPLVSRSSSALQVIDLEHAEVVATASFEGLYTMQRIGAGMFFADIDGDGMPEVGIGTSRDVLPFFRIPSLEALATIPYLYEDPAPGQEPRVRLQYGSLDVDRDGTDEIIVFPGATSAYEVWSYEEGVWVILDESDEWGGCPPTWMVTGDIDGDGHSELLFSEGERLCVGFKNGGINGYDPEWDVVAVLSGAPGATLPTMARFPMGYVSERLAVGDYDGDGRDDVLVIPSDSDVGTAAKEVAVLFADGEGGLKAPLLMDTGVYTGGATLGVGNFDGGVADKLLGGFYRISEPGESHTTFLIEISPAGLEMLDLGQWFGAGSIEDDVNHDGVADVLGIGVYVSISP